MHNTKTAIYTVSDELSGERLDKGLVTLVDYMSRSSLANLIKQGHVLLNDKIAKPSSKLSEGDTLYMELPEGEEPSILAEDIPLDILFEDDDVLVVNKPKGMVVHPSAGHYNGTLVNAILFHCKDSLSGINGVLRPGIVHRIDMDTTGSVIICKNDRSHLFLAQQFKEHSIERVYHAIVHGNVKSEDGVVEGFLGRSPKDRLKMAVLPTGKWAKTHYHVEKRFRNFTYITCRLETGRTHQIRVHMASIGHPLLGDSLYGPASSKYQGQCLHAMTLGFTHPRDSKRVVVNAPLPDYFIKLLNTLPTE